MTRAISLPLLLTLAVALGACAAGAGDGERAPRAQQDLLTDEQIQAGSHQTAYDAVRSLRPAWLRERPGSITNPEGAEVVVYVDGARMDGGVNSLRQVRADAVERMQYMSPSDATTRFGTGHMGGAILIMSRRR